MKLSIEELEIIMNAMLTQDAEYGLGERQNALLKRLMDQLAVELDSNKNTVRMRSVAETAMDELNDMLGNLDDPTIDNRYSD